MNIDETEVIVSSNSPLFMLEEKKAVPYSDSLTPEDI